MSTFEERLRIIRAMPDGPEKEKAILDLTRDYQNRQSALETQQLYAQRDLESAMEMPQARTAGPSGNPFAVAIAPNVMEYAAQGLRAYDANKRRNAAAEGLEGLSAGRESGLGELFRAGVNQSAPMTGDAVADKLRGDAMTSAGFGNLGMDEEEMLRLLRGGYG